MFGFKLDKTRSLTSQINSSQPVSLHSVAASSPEPEATESGIIPGRALFDKSRSATPSESSQSENPHPTRPYSLRAVRVVTSKYAELKARIAEQQEKRKNRKTPSKKSSVGSLTSAATSFKSATTHYVSDSEPSRSRVEGDSGPRPAAGSGKRGSASDCDLPGQRVQSGALAGAATAEVPNVPGVHVEGSCVDHGAGRGAPACDPVPQPPPTGQSDRDPSQLPADYWNFHLDHGRLAREVARLAHVDPDELSQVPPEDLEAILDRLVDELPASKRQQIRDSQASQQTPKETAQQDPKGSVSGSQVFQGSQTGSQTFQGTQGSQVQQASPIPHDPRRLGTDSCRQTEGQAHAVRPPGSTVQARLVANLPIVVGGGHHLNQPRTANRPEPNTDTETETEPEDIIAKPIINPSTLSRILNSGQTHQQSNSPSPLPSSHQPVNTQTGSTQSSQHVNHVSASHHPRRPTGTSRSSNGAGPSRPRGNASQESSRARRASKLTTNEPESTQDTTTRFPPAMRQAFNLARSRYRLRLQIERKRRADTDHTSAYAYHLPPELEEVRRPTPPDLMEDDEEERVAAEAESSNRDPKRKRKPKPAACDVHGNERHVLTIAKAHLFVYSVVEGAWQTRGLVTTWAHAIYRLTWEEEYPGLAYEAPSTCTIQCMVNGQPTFRGKSKDGLRPFTEFYWGFKKPASTPSAIAHNIALVQKLSPNSFHCLSYDPPFGHYEGEALKMAIAIVFFANPTAVGVVFRNYFEPLPETAVAYVLANMQFCIEEYSTGKFQPRELNAADMLNKYVAHLRGLKRARRKARVRFERLARDWFDFGFEYSGSSELEDPFTQPLTLEADIRPDTPTPDKTSEHDYLREPDRNEVQPELDENGRYLKRAKGKGRA